MKVRVKRFSVGDYYVIEYKKWFWHQYDYTWSGTRDSTSERHQPYLRSFGECVILAKTLTKESVKAHNKEQDLIHKENIERLRNKKKYKIWRSWK